MYPAHVLSLFPPYPRDANRVFIAIPFSEPFKTRFDRVIKPGVEAAGLEAHLVSIPKIANSIPVEIVTGIAQARLVLADVTAIEGHRNGNVMYEVGIAHAARQPEEVLLFRSDHDRLLFDIAPIRVNDYEPEVDPSGAKDLVEQAVRSAINEIDTTRSLAVRRAAEALDYRGFLLLLHAGAHGEVQLDPPLKTMGDVVGNLPSLLALFRLIEMGLVAATHSAGLTEALTKAGTTEILTEDLLSRHIRYQRTPFGKAVMVEVMRRWGITYVGS